MGPRHDLPPEQSQTCEDHGQTKTERQRLRRLRHRLKRRADQQWAAEREAMRLRELAIAYERRKLQDEKRHHDQVVARFLRQRLRLNTEMELGRRHLRADRLLLRRRQHELQAKEGSLKQRESALVQEEYLLARTQEDWQALRRERNQEIVGLENRIANLRSKLEQQQRDLQQLRGALTPTRSLLPGEIGTVVSAAAIPVPEGGTRDARDAYVQQREWQLRRDEAVLQARAAALERLAGDLSDQRRCVAEELELFAIARHRWAQDHEEAAAALESLAVRLRDQDVALESRRRALERAEGDLHERARQIDIQRKHVESRKAMLLLEASAWEREREQVLAQLPGKEALRLTCPERDLYEQQLQNLREEVERLAGLLLAETDSLLPRGQAA